jgi:hypothetical protein
MYWSIGWYSIGRDPSYLLGWGGLASQGIPSTSLILWGLLDLVRTRGHRSGRLGTPVWPVCRAGPATGTRTGQTALRHRSDRSVLPGRLGAKFECQHMSLVFGKGYVPKKIFLNWKTLRMMFNKTTDVHIFYSSWGWCLLRSSLLPGPCWLDRLVFNLLLYCSSLA